MATVLSAVLFVESGLHQAGRAEISAGRTRVGPTMENDIVISDLRGGGACFELEHRGRDVVIHADVPVEFASGPSLKREQSRRWVQTTRFTCAGVDFTLDIAAPGLGSGAGSIGFGVKSAIAVAVGVGMLSILLSLGGRPAAMQPAAAIETTASIPPTAGGLIQPGRQGQAAALDRLREHLASAELGSLVLTAEPDGSIEARGQIWKSQEAAWHEVGRWFDAIEGGQAVLVDAVNVVPEAPPLTIQAVWPGRNPYVIDGSGSRQFVGAALPSGWTISDIDRSRVLVKRGNEMMAVRF
jgi:Inner membrane component of T3SS, periplasmic domain